MTSGGLPPHSVRVHPRARRVRIRVSAREGVVVTLPPGVPRTLADEALAARSEWVSAALARVAPAREALLDGAAALLPAEVRFRATGEAWGVRLLPSESAAVARESAGELVVRAAARADALSALRRWLRRAARARLVPLLQAAAAEHGCEVPRVTVRCQRTRWGSRSSRGTVSLNRNLVFLPREAVHSVILHELAHTRHHDHSAAFRRELAAMDPAWERSRDVLRLADEYVPAWALEP
ncbi:MAG: M48 family metallopeptidase [Coriobacteriia bacterium]|nr:M48 family metallopeptidase [Coriobacteriia bacterium]